MAAMARMPRALQVLAVLGAILRPARALDNGLALTPPMGWLSWERYMCNTNCKSNPDSCISEQLYTAMADELVKGGYRDAGYVYVNIDVSSSCGTRYRAQLRPAVAEMHTRTVTL